MRQLQAWCCVQTEPNQRVWIVIGSARQHVHPVPLPHALLVKLTALLQLQLPAFTQTQMEIVIKIDVYQILVTGTLRAVVI
jgi:hypothetical protein